MTLRRPRTWTLSIALWTLFGVLSGLQIWLSMITHGHALWRVVLCQVLVWEAWALFGVVVAAMIRRLPLVPPRPLAIAAHLAVAGALGVLHAAWWVGLELAIVPYDVMNPTSFHHRFPHILLQMPLELILYVVVALSVVASDTYRQVRERELRAAQLEKSLAEARLHALELQIQPHFLFNTLNAIGALVRVGQAAEAAAMLAGLSDLLRYALDRAGDACVTVQDEIAAVRRYLELQRLRFPDRLSFRIDAAPDAQRGALPALLLQPLAENAIRHGIARSDRPGRVLVRAFRENGSLTIEVYNTGALPERIVKGIGLSNTEARLAQLHPGRHRFELAAAADGVVARVTLPWSEVA